jgi:hypothetical protein
MIMNCIAEGEPLPDVAWQRGWTEIVPGGRISILPNNSLRFVKVCNACFIVTSISWHEQVTMR